MVGPYDQFFPEQPTPPPSPYDKFFEPSPSLVKRVESGIANLPSIRDIGNVLHPQQKPSAAPKPANQQHAPAKPDGREVINGVHVKTGTRVAPPWYTGPLQGIARAGVNVQSVIANLPGIRDIGNLYRNSLWGRDVPVRIDWRNSQQLALVPVLTSAGFFIDEAGNVMHANGQPVTTNALAEVLTATISGGAAPGLRMTQVALRRVTPRIVPREGGLIQETTPVRASIEQQLERQIGRTPGSTPHPIPASQSAEELALATRQGASVLPSVGARLETGPVAAPHSPPPVIGPPASALGRAEIRAPEALGGPRTGVPVSGEPSVPPKPAVAPPALPTAPVEAPTVPPEVLQAARQQHALAVLQRDEFLGDIQGVAHEVPNARYPVELEGVSAKSPQSILDSMRRSGRPEVTDALRQTLVVQNLDQVGEVTQALANRGYQVVNQVDRRTTPGGFTDIVLSIRKGLDDPLIKELRLQTPRVFQVSQTFGHDLYSVTKALQSYVLERGDTPMTRTIQSALQREIDRIYGDAYALDASSAAPASASAAVRSAEGEVPILSKSLVNALQGFSNSLRDPASSISDSPDTAFRLADSLDRLIAMHTPPPIADAASTAAVSIPRVGVTPSGEAVTVSPAAVSTSSPLTSGATQAVTDEAIRQQAAKVAETVRGQEIRSDMTSVETGLAGANAQRATTPPLTVNIPMSPAFRSVLASKAGAVNLAPIQQYLARQHTLSVFTGNVADQLYQISRQADASAVEARNLIRSLGATEPRDWEAVYHALERPETVTLTPRQQQLFAVMRAIRDETERIKLSLPKPIRPITGVGYVRRFALNVGSTIDRALSGGVGGRISALRRTTSAFKHREFVSLTDPSGVTRVVVRDGERLLTPDGQFLGTMTRVKSYQELLNQDLAPAERQLEKLRHQIAVFTGWSTRNPRRVAVIADALSKRLETVTSVLADQVMTLSPILARDVRAEQARISRLVTAFHDARSVGSDTAVKKLSILSQRLQSVRQRIKEIEARYDPEFLTDRVFVGKDGTRYSLGVPSTAEVEAQTSTRYYKNALASVLYDHQETMQIARSNAFLEHLKTDPEFLRSAVPPDQAWRYKGWVTTHLPQFYGWVMEPKVAATFDAALPQTREAMDIIKALRWISQSSVNIGFINPLIHTPNVAMNWTIDRGTVRWLNPAAYRRLVVSTTRAWNAAAHINEDYLQIMRDGGAVMQENGAAAKVRDTILSMAREELQKSPQIVDGLATSLGRTAADILNAPYWFSHRVTWLSNDLTYLQRVFERELEGMPRAQAIAETNRFIPNYRIPGTIRIPGTPFESADLSRIFRNRGAVIFAPYHYGILKAWGQMTKGLLGRVPMADRAAAADKLATAGILLLVVAPAMDYVFQEISGQRTARARRPGLLTPIYDLLRVHEGTLAPEYAVESVVSPSPLVGSAITLAEQREKFTSPIQSIPQKVGAFAGLATEGLAPFSVRQMLQTGASVPQTLLSPVVSFPKRTPAESALLQYIAKDQHLRQAEVNALTTTDGPEKSARLAHIYNERLRALVTKALQDEAGLSPHILGRSIRSTMSTHLHYDVDPSEIPDLADQFIQRFGVKLLTDPAVQQRIERRQFPFSVPQELQKPMRQRTYDTAIP